MKHLLTMLCVVFFAISCTTKAPKDNIIRFDVPERESGQTDVLQLTADKIDTVRVGFIGIGGRGGGAVWRYAFIPTAKIAAICDLKQERLDFIQKSFVDNNINIPYKIKEYCGDENEWKKMCESDDIDLIYITTDWGHHTPMAVYAMEHGKHVVMEVPAATSLDECWQLVNTAEKTRKHCMMLENCCYDYFELTTLNMIQQGVLGEIVHGEGAYIHELKSMILGDGWRKGWNMKHNGNLYPTHGLGPVCQAMNIHRGDKMDYLVSISSNQFGMTQLAKEHYGENSPEAKATYARGDMNTTIIRTAKGKTILVQHDVTSPRPYSRLHTISGTKGFIQKYPTENIALVPTQHAFLTDAQRDSVMKAYEHPIVKQIGEAASKVGGHGGMDYIMDWRLIYCLNKGLPLDMDVYDAAEWSSLVELTRVSLEANGNPVEVP
ncbi:MAG: Gfo/Idh/MocA family oxidoreductase, partial [Rikenellaceae bacterium]